MPKIAIDYSTRQVSFYKFVCQNEDITSSYVGHTVDFIQRKGQHKRACNNPNLINHHFQIYQTIRDNGGWDNWRMIEIESRLVKDRREADRIEQEWMNELKSNMNTQKSFRGETKQESHHQYYIDNADKNREKMKQYRIKHADEAKEYKKQYAIKNAVNIKEYRIKNADKIKEQKKQAYLKRKEKSKLNALSL